MVDASYILTSDGHYGVVVGETENYYKVNMAWDTRKGHTKFSKLNHKQHGNGRNARTMKFVEYKDVPSVK